MLGTVSCDGVLFFVLFFFKRNLFTVKYFKRIQMEEFHKEGHFHLLQYILAIA